MTIQTEMKANPMQALAVRALGALHRWCQRRYRRELLRAELRRIGRELKHQRRQLPPERE